MTLRLPSRFAVVSSAAVLTAASLALPQRAGAVSYPFSSATGNWNSAETWTPNGGNTPPAAATDFALIARGFTVTLETGDDFTLNAAGIGHSSIGGLNSLTAALVMTGGALRLNAEFNVGESRGGTFDQNGGALIVGGDATVGKYYTLNATQPDTWNLSGGSVTITNNLRVGLFSQANVGSADATFNQTGGTSTVTVGNDLVIGSTHAAAASRTFAYHLGTGGTLTVIGVITGNPQGTRNFTFNGGTLQAGSSQAAFLSGLTDAFIDEGGATIDSQAFNIGIDQPLLHTGTGTDGGLTKRGAGTLTLSGANTYTGVTTIKGGTLLVTGRIAGGTVTVNAGTLGGADGFITGAVTVGDGMGSADAILSPGAGIGTLSTGPVSFLSDAAFKLEINTNTLTTDLLTSTGTINLGEGVLPLYGLDLGGTALTGAQTFTFIRTAGGVTGTFAGLAEGAALTIGPANFNISYAANGGRDVVLTAVPGPGTDDSDGDGTGDLAEIRLGLDPHDGNSRFEATVSNAGAGEGATISWPGKKDLTFVIEQSRELTSGSWEGIHTVIVASDGVQAFTDPAPPGGRAFYRVRLLP